MDTPEQQNEMGRIMQRDAAIKAAAVKAQENLDGAMTKLLLIIQAMNNALALHNQVLTEILGRVEALERGLVKETIQ